MNLAKAIKIASVAFESKTDKGSNPYILHCLHVMNEVKHYGEFTMICAVLHDLIEDTNWTKEDLIKENFTEDHLRVIENLTHNKNEDYMQYIKRIANDPVARVIKIGKI